MSQLEKQCKIIKTVPISSAVTQFLQQEYETFDNRPKKNIVSIGGVTKDLKYSWIANGPKLQVIDVENGTRVASWLFGGILRDKRAHITCVVELSNSNGSTSPLFVIGLDCDISGGMICIFDIMGSKILRTIQLDDRVCNIHIVDSGDNIPGILKSLDGILAVGTCGGDTYLVDLCKHMWISEPHSLEIVYHKLFKLSCSQINLNCLESYRANAVQKNEHLAIQLNVSTNSLFMLTTPQGTDALQLDRDKVRISNILYVPKLISLLVGYNFGAWQIYNLLTLELEYTSPVYEEIIPVSHFAYQEPSDDPRAFCYVWTIYSCGTESKRPAIPLAAMYALSYESKENIEGYGVLYQNFMSCSLRFQMDLLPLNGKPKDGYCISLQTCMMMNSSSLNIDNTADHNLTLCMMVWSVWSDHDVESPDVIMGIIDLDQWYKEQMPATLRDRGNECYIAQFDLSRILNLDDKSPILNVAIEPSSISPFITAQRLEEHYYPTALTFDFIVMQKTHFTFVKNNGLQRTLLLSLEKNGAAGFLNAHNLARQCIEAGLHPINNDVLSPKLKSTSHIQQLLSLALEFNLIGLLTSCAEEWATGAYASAGCTLGVFVEWASQRSEILQQKAHELCIPLFDYSDINLDCNARKILDQCAIQMHHLSSIFKIIHKHCSEQLNVDAKIEINEQLRAIQMFSDHLEVLQWLLNVGLLPEAPIHTYVNLTDGNGRMRAPYPADELIKYYNERRIQLNNLIDVQSENKSCELLFIDNLIEYECGGDRLRNEWSRSDSNSNNGLYPPSSIQSLLRTYLIDNVSLEIKHTILVYVFLDLAMTLDQTKYASIITHLIKFPAVFRLTPCHIKMTQAFWQLDHGDFQTGMEQLLDPLIGGGTAQDELKPWQHRMVLHTLLANKQHKFAALYIQIRQPPFTDVNEICNAMYLLLSNNMLHAAFEFQRRHQTVHNKSIILEKFFEGCLKDNLMTSALKLSLSSDEEKVLIEVLRKHKKIGKSLQLMYYLQRSRGFDAMKIDDKYSKDGQRFSKMGLIGQQSIELPQILLNTYTTFIPNISKSVFTNFQSQIHGKNNNASYYNQVPTPMSIKIKEVNKNIKYKSNAIINSINKIRETWSNDLKNDETCLESTPFLCTPKRKAFEKQSVTPITYPKITYQSDEKNEKKRMEDDFDADLTLTEQNPTKRFKFGNDTMTDVRLLTSPSTVRSHTAPEKLLLTPIVKRKYSESPKYSESTTIPHSILKTRQYNSQKNRRSRSITPKLEDCADSLSEASSSSSNIVKNHNLHEENTLPKKTNEKYADSILGATPRKNLVRTPRPAVHFEDASLTENNASTSVTTMEPVSVNLSSGIETRLSKKRISTIDVQDEESKLREEEVESVARKLSRKGSSPYKSIKPRKSLQRTVLEESLVKNITPALKRSKRIVSRSSVSNINVDSDKEVHTDKECSNFDENITICSSPMNKENTSSQRKSVRIEKKKIIKKQLDIEEKSDSFVQRMEEKYSHATASSFSSRSEDAGDTYDTKNFEKRIEDKYRKEKITATESRLVSTPPVKTDRKIVEEIHVNTVQDETLESDTIIHDEENSIVTESFIERVEKKYGYGKYGRDSPETTTSNVVVDIKCPKIISKRVDDMIVTTSSPVKIDRNIINEILVDIAKVDTLKSDEIIPDEENSIVTESFIERVEKKFGYGKYGRESPDEITNTSNVEDKPKLPEIISKKVDDLVPISPVNIDPKTNDDLNENDDMLKSVEITQNDESLVTDSFIECVEKKYGYGKYGRDSPETTSSNVVVDIKCPKIISKRVDDMIVTTSPVKIDKNIIDEILVDIAKNKILKSDEIIPDEESSIVTESFIERVEKKYGYGKYGHGSSDEITTSNVNKHKLPEIISKKVDEIIDPISAANIDTIISDDHNESGEMLKSVEIIPNDENDMLKYTKAIQDDKSLVEKDEKHGEDTSDSSLSQYISVATMDHQSNKIDNELSQDEISDIPSSKEDASSLYCSIEENVNEEIAKNVDLISVDDDSDYSLRMEVDDDEDDDDDEQDKSEDHSESQNEEEEESEDVTEDSSEEDDQIQHDPNKIVEISSDDDDEQKNNVEEKIDTEEKFSQNSSLESRSIESEENSYDGSNSSSSNKPKSVECINFEENECDNVINQDIQIEESEFENITKQEENLNVENNENLEIIEVNEVLIETEACGVYDDLDIVVEMCEENQLENLIQINEVTEIQQEKSENELKEAFHEESINTDQIVHTQNQQGSHSENQETDSIPQLEVSLCEKLSENVEVQIVEAIKNQPIPNETITVNNIDQNYENQSKKEQSKEIDKTENQPIFSESNEISNTIYEKEENIKKKESVKPQRRTRKNSANSNKSEALIPVTTKTIPRTRRATSIDITSPPIISPPQRRITRSTSDMNISKDVIKPNSIGTRRRSSRNLSKDGDDADKPAIEEYSTSRRLTRNQKSMLEKIPVEVSIVLSKVLEESPNSNSEEENDNIRRGPIVKKIDPIKLLDKQSFEGPVDPDEQARLLQRSPASSIKTTSSLQSVDTEIFKANTRLRNLRSRSIDLETTSPSVTPHKTKIHPSSSSDIVVTPQRRTSRKLSLNKTPVKDDGSDSGSVTSQISARSKSSIIKRLLDPESPEIKSSPRRSSRLSSPQTSSIDEHNKGQSSSMKSTRRSILQSELPVISEETVETSKETRKRKETEDTTGTIPAAKRNRSQKTEQKSSTKGKTKSTTDRRGKKLK